MEPQRPFIERGGEAWGGGGKGPNRTKSQNYYAKPSLGVIGHHAEGMRLHHQFPHPGEVCQPEANLPMLTLLCGYCLYLCGAPRMIGTCAGQGWVEVGWPLDADGRLLGSANENGRADCGIKKGIRGHGELESPPSAGKIPPPPP